MNLSELDTAFGDCIGPMCVIDDDGSVTYANLAAARLLGTGVDDLIGTQLGKHLAISDISELVAPENGENTTWQPPVVEYTDPNGMTRFLDIRATHGHSPETRGSYALMITDVSAQQMELRKLRATSTRLSHVLDGANIGVFEIDLSTGNSVVSNTWCKLMGLGDVSVDDAQKIWLARIHPEDLHIVQDADTACIKGEKERSQAKYRMRSADDTCWQWMTSDAVVSTRDDTGKPLTLAGAQSDVTTLVNTERELRRSEQQFRSSFEDGPIGIAIVGLDGAWLRVNPALSRMFGYSQDSFQKMNFQSLTHPDDLDDDLKLMNQLLHGAIPSYQLEKRYYRADGEIIWAMLSVGLVRDSQGQPEHFISQLVDVTEERRLSELKSEFVATVSHELRTPLTSVIGALKLVTAQFGDELPEAAKSLLNIAQHNGDRLHGLINDILDYEKSSGGQFTLDPALHALKSLLDDSIDASQPYFDQHGVRVASKYSDPRVNISVDAKRFHQIMANLLSNAAKFARGGSDIDVCVSRIDDMAKVTVTNWGSGIPDSYKSHIFQPFSQAHPSAIRTHGGTGLGLSITKKIVEQMGGEIGYQSVEGKKTTFWFTLPVVDGPLAMSLAT